MNIISIGLHCLDMRDFNHPHRDTPFLDHLREQALFIPESRAQGHHQGDSLNAELTGIWTSRCTDSVLDESGFTAPQQGVFPKTVLEYFKENGFDILTSIGFIKRYGLGSAAVPSGLKPFWMKDEPSRWVQFNHPHRMSHQEWIRRVTRAKKFYAHILLRETHRPWADELSLYRLLGKRALLHGGLNKLLRRIRWPFDAYCARRLALEQPEAFTAHRLKGLARADRRIEKIFNETQHLEDVGYLVYSNHGEVFDHFKGHHEYTTSRVGGYEMVECTSHGPYPYEVLYANMQMWVLPGRTPRIIQGMGRSIDIAPTLLDLGGITPEGMDGESMLPTFDDGVLPPRDRYAESPLGPGCISYVREDGLKFLSVGSVESEDAVYGVRGFADHRLAVFDLNDDPGEFNNLIHTPKGQDVMAWAIKTHARLKNLSTLHP